MVRHPATVTRSANIRGNMTKRRSSKRLSNAGIGLAIVAALVGSFLLLRSDPALASKLPPQVSKAIKSVPLPTGIPRVQVPTGLQQIQVPTGLPQIQLPSVSGLSQFGVQTKTSGCQAMNGMPDSACTPGAVVPGVTAAQICKAGYASSVRDVPSTEKDQVYAEYGITSHTTGEYEVDHLVSLELGGSNDISNLWPEAAAPPPGFHQKDQVENYLHDQVCSGSMSLPDAQKAIATDWEGVYNQMPK